MPDDFVLDLGRLQQYYDDSEEDEKRNEWAADEKRDEWAEDEKRDTWTEEGRRMGQFNKVSVSVFNNLSSYSRSG